MARASSSSLSCSDHTADSAERATTHSRTTVRDRPSDRLTSPTRSANSRGFRAVGVACVLNKKTGNRVLVDVLGGQLEIEWDEADNNVWMTGPARTVFEGSVDTALF